LLVLPNTAGDVVKKLNISKDGFRYYEKNGIVGRMQKSKLTEMEDKKWVVRNGCPFW